MDIKDIQNLIKFVAKSGASEVKLRDGGHQNHHQNRRREPETR